MRNTRRSRICRQRQRWRVWEAQPAGGLRDQPPLRSPHSQDRGLQRGRTRWPPGGDPALMGVRTTPAPGMSTGRQGLERERPPLLLPTAPSSPGPTSATARQGLQVLREPWWLLTLVWCPAGLERHQPLPLGLPSLPCPWRSRMHPGRDGSHWLLVWGLHWGVGVGVKQRDGGHRDPGFPRCWQPAKVIAWFLMFPGELSTPSLPARDR